MVAAYRMFRDRQDAAEQLAERLQQCRFDRPVVLGIPRGGVVVSAAIARKLGAAHGVVVARKLGAPYQPELAIGAVSASGAVYVNREVAEDAGADETYLAAEVARQIARAERYEKRFDGRHRPAVIGHDVIVVDDGVATGAPVAAIRAMKAEGAQRVVFAAPVGPPHTIRQLRDEADDVICLIEEPSFFAVGQFYRDFRPIEDDEVRQIMHAMQLPASEKTLAGSVEERETPEAGD